MGWLKGRRLVTYSYGEQGFRDKPSMDALKKLRPISHYGWSKYLVAACAARGERLIVGLHRRLREASQGLRSSSAG